MSFSEREGLMPRKALQTDSMDEDLKTGLWNALYTSWLGPDVTADGSYLSPGGKRVFSALFRDFFKWPLDVLPLRWDRTRDRVRKGYADLPWPRVYDLVEFAAQHLYYGHRDSFVQDCNCILELECSAYRFVGGKIARITSEEEIHEIEDAIQASGAYPAIKTHLNTALARMADRESPDYRNSIKESISAVESVCRLISGKPKATLGDALKVVREKVGLHQALENAFSALYGYTSNAEGIRHALLDEPSLAWEDAKFMLVACSAFVNYLLAKASKPDLKL